MNPGEMGPKMAIMSAYDFRKKIVEPIIKLRGKIKKEHFNFSVERRAMDETVEFVYFEVLKKILQNDNMLRGVIKFKDEITNLQQVKIDTKLEVNQNKIKKVIKDIVANANTYEVGHLGNLSKFAIERFKFGENTKKINENKISEEVANEAEEWYFKTFGIKPDPEIIKNPADMARAQNNPKEHNEMLKEWIVEKQNKPKITEVKSLGTIQEEYAKKNPTPWWLKD